MTPDAGPWIMQVKAELPSVPNFVQIAALGSKGKLPISDLTDEQLRELGAAWTEKLIAHARGLRESKRDA